MSLLHERSSASEHDLATSLTPTAPRPARTPRPAGSTSAPVLAQEWMGALPAALRLDELAIPGTHDSGATLGGRWVACQDLPIGEQLSLGVRYLDIRVSLQRGRFGVHHNQWFQQLTLDEVLQTCRDFLAAHPTECLLLCLTPAAPARRPGRPNRRR